MMSGGRRAAYRKRFSFHLQQGHIGAKRLQECSRTKNLQIELEVKEILFQTENAFKEKNTYLSLILFNEKTQENIRNLILHVKWK